MIQITQTDVSTDDNYIACLREEFSYRSCVTLPHLLGPSLLQHVLRRLATANFMARVEVDEGEEFGQLMCLPSTDPTLFLFHLLLNRPKLFHVIERITGCAPIGNFFGRIHRSYPAAHHHIAWHGDNADSRLIGLTPNFSTAEYSGGVFQLRDQRSKRMLHEITKVGLGDAFIFRIAPALQHQLTPVDRGGCRTVGVGWFRAQPDWPIFAKAYFLPSS